MMRLNRPKSPLYFLYILIIGVLSSSISGCNGVTPDLESSDAHASSEYSVQSEERSSPESSSVSKTESSSIDIESSSTEGENSSDLSSSSTGSSSETEISSSSELATSSATFSSSSSVIGSSSSATQKSSSSSLISSSDEVISSSVALAPLNVLLFTKTTGWKHGSIGAGVQMVKDLALKYGFTVNHTENAGVFTEESVADVDVVYFLNTTQDILNAEQEAVFEQFITNGGGFVGNHAAADTEYDWSFYKEVIGVNFKSHPPGSQHATVHHLGNAHPATDHMVNSFEIDEECYNFRGVPNASFTQLLEFDESTYDAGGDAMGYHPMTWYRDLDPGRAFYTAFGHFDSMYGNEFFQKMILNALFWSANRDIPEWE